MYSYPRSIYDTDTNNNKMFSMESHVHYTDGTTEKDNSVAELGIYFMPNKCFYRYRKEYEEDCQKYFEYANEKVYLPKGKEVDKFEVKIIRLLYNQKADTLTPTHTESIFYPM